MLASTHTGQHTYRQHTYRQHTYRAAHILGSTDTGQHTYWTAHILDSTLAQQHTCSAARILGSTHAVGPWVRPISCVLVPDKPFQLTVM